MLGPHSTSAERRNKQVTFFFMYLSVFEICLETVYIELSTH